MSITTKYAVTLQRGNRECRSHSTLRSLTPNVVRLCQTLRLISGIVTRRESILASWRANGGGSEVTVQAAREAPSRRSSARWPSSWWPSSRRRSSRFRRHPFFARHPSHRRKWNGQSPNYLSGLVRKPRHPRLGSCRTATWPHRAIVFQEDVTARIAKLQPYAKHSEMHLTTLEEGHVYQEEHGSVGMVTLARVNKKAEAAGLIATVTLAVNPEAIPEPTGRRHP